MGSSKSEDAGQITSLHIPASFFAHTKCSTTSRSHKPGKVPDTVRCQKEPTVRYVIIVGLRIERAVMGLQLGDTGNGTEARIAGYREDETFRTSACMCRLLLLPFYVIIMLLLLLSYYY